MPEVNPTSDAIRSNYFSQERQVNIQKEIKERQRIEDGKLEGVEFRDKPKQLDRDDFLKLLVKQLTTQDPTAPVQDQQFIAQMAQFSALEQMKNMADGFQSMSNRQAVNLVGKFVIGKDFTSGESISGVAQALFFDSSGQPFLKVGGRAMTVKDIEMVGDPSMIKQEFGGTAQHAQPANAPVTSPSVVPGSNPEESRAKQTPMSAPSGDPASVQKPETRMQKPESPVQKTDRGDTEVPAQRTMPIEKSAPEKPARPEPPVSLRGGYGEWILPNLEFIG